MQFDLPLIRINPYLSFILPIYTSFKLCKIPRHLRHIKY